MRIFVCLTIFLASSAAHAESWTCSAPGLVTGSYDGGATASDAVNGSPPFDSLFLTSDDAGAGRASVAGLPDDPNATLLALPVTA